jgi:hypothetical protein
MKRSLALPVPSWEDFRTFGIAACVFWIAGIALEASRIAGSGRDDIAVFAAVTCAVGLYASLRVAYCSHRHARRGDPGPRSLLRP